MPEAMHISGEMFLLLQEMLHDIHRLEERNFRRDTKVLQALARIEAQGKALMTAADDIHALITELDATTNEIATSLTTVADRIQRILDQIRGGMTPAEVEAVKARFAGEITDIRAQAAIASELGKDPENPIP